MKLKLKKVFESLVASVTLVSMTMPVCSVTYASDKYWFGKR